jgi:8-oxo-dGTP diphosphatase
MDLPRHRHPLPTVDVVIETEAGIVLIRRRNPPPGWALPGGFVEHGERVEQAAVREALEETGLHVELVDLLGVYSDPSRDPRGHTLAVVFAGRAVGGALVAATDAAEAETYPLDALPDELAFDHAAILADYRRWRRDGRRPRPGPRVKAP